MKYKIWLEPTEATVFLKEYQRISIHIIMSDLYTFTIFHGKYEFINWRGTGWFRTSSNKGLLYEFKNI